MQSNIEPALNDIIDRIYAASTLEDAIYWRERFISRISASIARSNIFDPEDRDRVCLFAAAKAQAEQAIARLQMCIFAAAKAQAEQAIARLQMCIARNERSAWPSVT